VQIEDGEIPHQSTFDASRRPWTLLPQLGVSDKSNHMTNSGMQSEPFRLEKEGRRQVRVAMKDAQRTKVLRMPCSALSDMLEAVGPRNCGAAHLAACSERNDTTNEQLELTPITCAISGIS
jgi:hypothetical protein